MRSASSVVTPEASYAKVNTLHTTIMPGVSHDQLDETTTIAAPRCEDSVSCWHCHGWSR